MNSGHVAIDIEIILKNIPDQTERKYLQVCAKVIRNSKPPLQLPSTSTNLNVTLNKLSWKIINDNLILTKADNGNSITLITRVDYIEKMSKYTNKEFIEFKKDPNHKFQHNTLQAVRESTFFFSPSETFSLKELNTQSPILYGLLTLHKQDILLRPVVSFCQTPSYRLCQKLSLIFPTLTKFTRKYAVRTHF